MMSSSIVSIESEDKNNRILVCQASSCRRNGSEAVLLEIEELVSAVDNKCFVESSGCLGLCNEAPSAVVVKEDNNNNWFGVDEYFTSIDTLDKSVEVVTYATGKTPDVASSDLKSKLAVVRAIRAREEALSVYRWNMAIKFTLDQLRNLPNSRKSPDVLDLLNSISTKAGFQVSTLVARNRPPTMPTSIEKYSQWILKDVTTVSKHTAIIRFISKDRKRGTPHPR